jgi:hypothetical protein
MSLSSTGPILHPTMRHPLTGRPLEAVGVLPSGRIVWPIMGSGPENDPPERPEGVSEEEWEALGDPGKAAIVREREARQEAERKLAAAQARPTPPKNPPAPPAPPAPAPKADDQPDIAGIVQQAVNQAVTAAIKPFQEREEQRAVEEAAGKVRTAVLDAAKPLLQDETDAIAHIDLTKVVDDQGQADAAKIKAELDELLKKKPHLAKGPRIAPLGIGGGAPPAVTDAEKVKAVLADMQRATGVRIPASN